MKRNTTFLTKVYEDGKCIFDRKSKNPREFLESVEILKTKYGCVRNGKEKK